jgi:Mg2+-importing ATPase
MKYTAATSANFGNMFSMAGAGLLLPLLPKQILLATFSRSSRDTINQMRSILTFQKPLRWNIKFIRKL